MRRCQPAGGCAVGCQNSIRICGAHTFDRSYAWSSAQTIGPRAVASDPGRDRQGVADLSRPSAWGSLRPVTNVSGLTTYSAWSPERADGPFQSGAGWWDRRSTSFRRPSTRVRVGGCLTHADTDVILAPHRLKLRVLRYAADGNRRRLPIRAGVHTRASRLAWSAHCHRRRRQADFDLLEDALEDVRQICCLRHMDVVP